MLNKEPKVTVANREHPENIMPISVTLVVLNGDRLSVVSDAQPKNMPLISVTLLVLNVPWNVRLFMFEQP